jgi:hypothetical protein
MLKRRRRSSHHQLQQLKRREVPERVSSLCRFQDLHRKKSMLQ